MHSLHGNGGPPWQRVGRSPGEGRMLQELNTVGKLRSLDWKVPNGVADDYRLRVYDTRLEHEWLQLLAAEVGGGWICLLMLLVETF